MKKRKFLTLLPMVALLLSGCQTQVVPSDAPSSEESESTQEESSTSESTSEETSTSESTSEGTSTSESTSEESSPSESSGGEETTGSQDTGSAYVPGATAISYEVKIVSENTSLTQYDSMTLEVELYMYEYKEGDPTPTLVSTTKSSEVSDGVSLTVDNEAIIGIDGLVITALEAGTANIRAHWNVDDYIYDSDPVEFTVSEYIPTYTYEAKITSNLSEIEIGEHLVEVYLYTYADGTIVNPDGVKATESDVTLTSGDSSIIETTEGSLTIKAVASGTTTLTAEWIGHVDATDTITITVVSSGDTGGTTPEPEPEPEPEDVYTYQVKIENKDAYTSVLAGYGHEEEEIPALKIGLYTYKNSEQESVVYPTSTTEVSDLVISSSNSDLVDINTDLTLDIKVDTTLSDPVTITATWTGHYLEETQTTVASDSVDVYISYTPYPVYIENISFTQNEYVLYYGGNEGEGSTTVGVTYSPEVVDDSSYSIKVDNESVATFDPNTSTLTAVGVGSTYMTVSATYGGATGTAIVKVVEGKTDLTSISLSQSSYDLSYNDGYGSFTIGVGDASADINVTLNPENPDYKQLSVTNSDGYLSVEVTTTNMFVISVTDSAKEVLKDSSITTSLSIASTYYSNVEAQTLTVTIEQTPAEIAHPVEGILLTGSVTSVEGGYTASMQYNGTLTLGGENGDIAVSILPENAYSTAWSAEVSDNDSSKSLIELNGNATDGYTITPINGSDLTEDTDATVIITSEGNGSDGNKLSVELTITIIHQDSYPTSLTITEYQSSVNLISGSSETISVSYLVKDQRNNEMEGLGLSATVDNEANNTEVSITPTSSTGDFVITAGSVEGTATISFYLTDYPDIKAEQTITVTVTDQYHEISTVTYNGENQTINVEQTEDGINYGSFTVTSEMVLFSNETNDVDPEDEEKGFYLYTDSEYVTIDNDTNTITAATYNRSEDLTATIYIYSVANTSATPASFTVTIHDATDYTPTGVNITQTGDGITLVEGSSVYFESYYSVSVVPSYADGSYIVASSDNKLTVEKDGDYYKISAASDAVGAAEESTSASIIVYPTVDGSTYTGQGEELSVTITPVLPSTISTYTVNFTFNDDLPEYAALSIEGTLDGEDVSANLIGSGSNYSLTLTDVTPGATLAYSISIDYDRNAYSDAPTSAKTTIVTGGSTTLSLHGNASTKGAYTSDSLTINTGVSLSDVLIDPTVTMKNNITVNFYFTDENGSGNYKVPDYAKAYVAGYLTNGTYADIGDSATYTDANESSSGLTENGTDGAYYYSYTFSGIYNGNVRFDILFEYDTEITGSGFHDWSYTWEFDYTIDKYTVKDGDTLNVNINNGDPAEFIKEIVPSDEPTQFYFVILDQADSSSFGSILTNVDCQDASWHDLSIFNGSGSTSLTYTKTGGSQACLYNQQVGEADAGTVISYTYLYNSSWSNKIEIDSLIVPNCESGYYAVYLCMVNSSYVSASNSSNNWGSWTDFGSGNSGGWITGITDINSYISGLSKM